MAGDYSDLDEFPETWALKRIGDFASVKGGKRLPAGTALVSTRTNHPYLRVVDFKDRGIDKSGLMFVPEEVFPQIAKYIISSRDIYVSIVGTIGLVGVVDKSLDGANLTENAAKICNIADDVDRDYLAAFLGSGWGQHQIGALTVGSTQPKLALFRIGDIRVPLPPLPEQRVIASVLGALDDKIDLNRRMCQTLEEMARALFKSWFVDFDPVRAKMEGRDPGLPKEIADLFPNRLVNSELGPIPEGWLDQPLDEVADFLNGLALQKYPPRDGVATLPVLKIAQLKRGDTSSADRCSAEVPAPYQVVDGDLIFSWSGSLEVALWSGGAAALNQHLFKVTSDRFPRWCLYQWVCQHLPEFRQIAADKATTMGHIQRRHLSAARVAVPSKDVLRFADATLGPMTDRILAARTESRSLASLRDTLLPKLISGELRVPASLGSMQEVAT